ncbi:MAG TPA: type II secretion system F family protein [Thermoleophilaceae bacterium]|nr:type II secretion system F family protein [Thermoleophilaceae bacterium]
MTAEALAFAAAAAGAVAVADMRAFAAGGGGGAGRNPALARLGRRLMPRAVAAPADLERRLAEAGRPGGLDGSDLLAAKCLAALAGALAGLMLGTLAPGRLGLAAAAVGPVAGFLLPDLWLARRRADHVRAVRRDLPALLELLAVAVEGGLSPAAALAEAGRHSRAPLARAWSGLAAQVAVGVPLADALEAHRRELRIPEVDAFAGALARAVRHGAPLSDTLVAQAREARLARRRAIHEEAARAGPKMQLVVAVLLVPSVMLLVAAALLGALSGGATDALTTF